MSSQDDSTKPATPQVSPARRPYRAPELRSLGSIREVTWGGSPRLVQESTFTKGKTKM